MSHEKTSYIIFRNTEKYTRTEDFIEKDVYMFFNGNFTKTDYLLERSLDVESLRRKVISNNIANVDVPHFKRSEVNFESELKRAIMDKRDAGNKLPFMKSDPRHISLFVPRNIRSVAPRINLDYNTTYRNDGNNVDIEKEMVDAAKNMMRYNSYVTSLNQSYKMLKIAMKPA